MGTIIDAETGEVISNDGRMTVYTPNESDLATRTDAELVALSEAALEFTVAQLEDMPLEDAPKMRAQAQALDKLLAAYTRSKEAKLEASNNLTEARLRIERHTGAILSVVLKRGNPNFQLSSAPTIRTSDLQISNYQAATWQSLADIPEPAFNDIVWTGKEEGDELSTAYVLWKWRKMQMAEPDDAPPLPDGIFRVIYADPPWLYAAEQHGKGSEQYSKIGQDTVLATHYPSMPTEDICALPVRDIAADDAVLFIWTTSPKLFETADVIKAWGFTYKASIVWDKVKHNVGHYVSVRHEFLLIATRGSCLPDSHTLHDSVISIERTEHSAKPPYFRELIDQMYTPQGNDRIELFARGDLPDGWQGWGNE